MYRNFGNQGRGNSSFANSDTGSPHTGSSSVPTASTSTTQQEQETDELEGEKSRLQKEIAELQKKKEKLELVLEAHRPICKIEDSSSDSESPPTLSLRAIKMEQESSELSRSSSKPQSSKRLTRPKPKITIPTKPVTTLASVVTAPESESLHTPIIMSTPSFTPFTANLVFTYPSAPLDSIASHPTPSSSSSHHGNAQQSLAVQHCGIAHRRSSSSGDQSDHSLHSPTILSL
ncbi:hypothetical protein NHX12_011562 [Muraenolepis orangiensis]|uniref:Uncharacterized protein n=1 Tax=Muraenolepis orangiensis TaxID=630683 RepID=A0A9Q0I5U2_9TELE|nr:hypothetical protein NHX12_011562 [Muraenolepis orangiensis]